MDFLDTLYYGNTLLQWLIALSLVVLSFLAGRAIYWLFRTWARRLTGHSRSDIDDTLVNLVEEPAVALVVLLGTRYAAGTLTFPDGVTHLAGSSFTFVASLLVTWLVLRLYELLHKRYFVRWAAHTGTTLDDQLLPTLRSGMRFLIVTLGVIIALDNAGYDVATILAGLGIGGLAFALAAQDTVANIFGGLTILVQHPFRVGDRIIYDGRTLIVYTIGLRSSVLTDVLTEHMVYVPNSKFTSSVVTNVTQHTGHWVNFTCKLSPRSSPEQVEMALDLIRKALKENRDLDRFEDHVVRLDVFDGDAISILVFYHICNFALRHGVINAVNLAILREFAQHNIRMAAPVRLLRLERDEIAVPEKS